MEKFNNYVTQLCVVCCILSSAFSISSPLTSVASTNFSSLHWLFLSTLTLCFAHSLTLIDSSLPSEAEPELRTYISRRLSKGALLGGMGNIATVELR